MHLPPLYLIIVLLVGCQASPSDMSSNLDKKDTTKVDSLYLKYLPFEKRNGDKGTRKEMQPWSVRDSIKRVNEAKYHAKREKEVLKPNVYICQQSPFAKREKVIVDPITKDNYKVTYQVYCLKDDTVHIPFMTEYGPTFEVITDYELRINISRNDSAIIDQQMSRKLLHRKLGWSIVAGNIYSASFKRFDSISKGFFFKILYGVNDSDHCYSIPYLLELNGNDSIFEAKYEGL